MSRPARPYRMPYKPLRLKRRIVEAGVTQEAISGEISRQGYKCSRPLINQVINKGYMPGGVEEFKGAFERALVSLGVATDGIWEAEPEEREPKRFIRPRRGNGREQFYGMEREEVDEVNITKEYLDPDEIMHFGFDDDPFFELDDHREIWMSPQLKIAERQVYRTIKSRGIIAITGDYGMGKSTFLRHILSKLTDDRTIRVIMPDRLDRELMTGGLLTEAIISQLGGMKMPRSGGKRDALAKRLLEENMKAGVYTVLVIDEAHDLKEKIFISLKRLWDSGMIFKLIAIVLVGAGGDDGRSSWGLKGIIEWNPHIREFSERCYLVDLGRLNGNMGDYIDYRFRKAGRTLRDLCTDDAIKLLQQKAKTPNQVNSIATRALKQAYRDGKTKIALEHVNDA